MNKTQAAQKKLELAQSGAMSEADKATLESHHAFLAACNSGQVEVVAESLKMDTMLQVLAHVEDASGASGLCLAAKHGYVDVMEVLLKYGAYVNGKEGTRPPLCWAADAGHLEACQLLLTREGPKASVDARDTFGFTALLDAARSEKVAMAKFLLEHGADVDAATPTGLTCLHFAAQKNCMPLVTLLLEHGADITLRTETGFTAETLAGTDNHIEMVGTPAWAAAASHSPAHNALTPPHSTPLPPPPSALWQALFLNKKARALPGSEASAHFLASPLHKLSLVGEEAPSDPAGAGTASTEAPGAAQHAAADSAAHPPPAPSSNRAPSPAHHSSASAAAAAAHSAPTAAHHSASTAAHHPAHTAGHHHATAAAGGGSGSHLVGGGASAPKAQAPDSLLVGGGGSSHR